MPNFHVHWLVAWQALDAAPGPALSGRDAYHKATLEYGRKVRQAFREASGAGRDEVNALFDQAIPDCLDEWRTGLYKDDAVREEVSCFAAFMLGACGPDFWMVPSASGLGVLPDFGAVHFDLGHYNRTHEQFRRSIEGIGNRETPQANLERSYFLGMATHVAADLVLHELVNVPAGAYNLLKKKNWKNEHPRFPSLSLWNTHNKVEHYWDSFVRYRYFGDLAPELAPFDEKADEWMEPLGFPLAESLCVEAEKLRDGAAKQALVERLTRVEERAHGKGATAQVRVPRQEVRVLLETPLVLPSIACDRVLGEGVPDGVPRPPALQPFVYDRVVHKRNGAYPARMVFQEAIDEALQDQMTDDRPWFARNYNEARKLRYFATERNSDPGVPNFSMNFLTYVASPDLDRLRAPDARGIPFGQAFYDAGVLKKVGRRAVGVAKSFAALLLGAYRANDPGALLDVGRFWNLDTGLGFEVQSAKTTTDKEVVTRLDFVHVLSARIRDRDRRPMTPEGDLGFTRPAAAAEMPFLPTTARTGAMTQVPAAAFPVRASGPGTDDDQPFDAISAVEEPDANAFLDRIRVRGDAIERLGDLDVGQAQDGPNDPPSVRAERRTQKFLDAFFAKEESAIGWTNPFGTVSRAMKKQFAAQPLKERLTLELQVPIPALGDPTDEPGMFLYCDQAIGIGDAATIAPRDWLEKKAKLVGYWTPGGQPAPEVRGSLRVFTARVLVNPRKGEERRIAAGVWNGVVPYGPNKRFYGRNFAVATGRKFVLYPSGSGAFDPGRDFETYSDVTPTEHVFLTIYPLVKTPWGVVDMFSDEQVSRDVFDRDLRKITALEWKKVVLFYRLASGKTSPEPTLVQLKRCFVDGVDCPVVPAPSGRAWR